MVPVCAIVEALACVLWYSMLAEVSGAGLHSVPDDQGTVPNQNLFYRAIFVMAEQQAYAWVTGVAEAV